MADWQSIDNLEGLDTFSLIQGRGPTGSYIINPKLLDNFNDLGFNSREENLYYILTARGCVEMRTIGNIYHTKD